MRDAPASMPGLLHRLSVPPQRVAVLRASRIGDFLCAIPALRALRAALPDARITLITVPLLRGLAERLPYVDEVAPFPGFPGIAIQLFEAQNALHFLQRMQAKKFDLALQLQGSGVYSNPFLLLLGARYNAGFVRTGDAAVRLDAALPLPQQGHEIHRALALPVFLGALPAGDHTEFPLTHVDHLRAEALLQKMPRPLLGLHPTAHDPLRRWPLDRFEQAARTLHARYGGTIVILGGAGEYDYNRVLAERLGGICRDLTGLTALGTLGAVMTRLALLITSDSGPAHIAYALGAPTVTVFRAGGSYRYGPPQAGPFRALEPPASVHCVGVDQVTQSAMELIEWSATETTSDLRTQSAR
mgnify:CR=1 FL=1